MIQCETYCTVHTLEDVKLYPAKTCLVVINTIIISLHMRTFSIETCSVDLLLKKTYASLGAPFNHSNFTSSSSGFECSPSVS